jgi:prepilin-type N-terminal cleavage/methylation domain-containing protein
LFVLSGGVEDSTPGYERSPLRGEISAGGATIARPVSRAKASGRAARGFTLLEAVLALAILSAVAVVCVGIRTQSLSSARRMEERHAEQRDTQAIFEMLTAGLLPPPEAEKDSFVRRWKGEYLGFPYELEAARETMPNPVFRGDRADSAGLSDRIVMWRYTLSYRGKESEFLWHE